MVKAATSGKCSSRIFRESFRVRHGFRVLASTCRIGGIRYGWADHPRGCLANAAPPSQRPAAGSEKSRLQELYKQFIDEASKLYADALVYNQSEISAFVSVYALISRMRILSNPIIVKKAEAVVRMVADTYFSPNKTFTDLQHMVGSRNMDPLKDFSKACREELQTLTLP
jgi:hypothetical protein